MNAAIQPTTTVEAEVRTEIATAQIVRFELPKLIDHTRAPNDTFLIDMCLTPRPPQASACYPNRWRERRFERIGEILAVPPGEVVQVTSEQGQQTSIICQLNPESMAKCFDSQLEWTDWRLESALRISDRSLYGLLLRVTREVLKPGFASEVLVDLLASQLAIELGRYCGSLSERPSKGGLAAWRLRLIDERVREQGKSPTLSSLAEACNLSIRQLSRGFRISRGCSIGEYVELIRIDSAKRLLIKGQSVKSVAYTMGFSSASSFSFAFRRATGLAPAEYQRLA